MQNAPCSVRGNKGVEIQLGAHRLAGSEKWPEVQARPEVQAQPAAFILRVLSTCPVTRARQTQSMVIYVVVHNSNRDDSARGRLERLEAEPCRNLGPEAS